MKKNKIILFLLFAWISSYSQNSDALCGFDSYIGKKDVQGIENMFQQASQKHSNTNLKTPMQSANKVIPVVVHVIHTGGSENISEAQILSQIEVLNEDFGKVQGTNGDGAGVDTKVRFCLANKDPDGNCTNGIVRVQSPLTNHQSYQRVQLTELSFWDNTRYLNIYVVKSINGGVDGYSSFPGGPTNEDGIVIRHSRFGNTGSASGLGRTATHELGHWLGLYHTFHNGCGTDLCTDGDYICDTPPQASPSFNCDPLNTCNNDLPDVADLKENYMNYTPDNCKNMYTQGQSDRMLITLDSIRQYIWTPANITSTGWDSSYVEPVLCSVLADFVTLTPEICTGNSIYFADKSLNEATSWTWSFPGGSPSMSTVQNPTVTYSTPGTYSVTLEVANDNSTDLVEVVDLIVVSPPGVGAPLSFAEDFDLGIYPPTNIQINNPDGGVTWELDSLAFVSGEYSIKINNLINTNYGSSDEMILPYLDFTSSDPDSTVYMKFKWAYAKSDPIFSDELLVLLSTDCGVNYEQVFYKTQSALATSPYQATPFIPDSSQWKNAYIPLGDYENESYVQLKIVNVTDGGNNLYIEDIYVGDDAGEVLIGLNNPNSEIKEMVLYPNPSRSSSTLEFSLKNRSTVEIEIYSILGRLMEYIDKEELELGAHRVELNTLDYAPGVYIVKVKTDYSEKYIKLLIE